MLLLHALSAPGSNTAAGGGGWWRLAGLDRRGGPRARASELRAHVPHPVAALAAVRRHVAEILQRELVPDQSLAVEVERLRQRSAGGAVVVLAAARHGELEVAPARGPVVLRRHQAR